MNYQHIASISFIVACVGIAGFSQNLGAYICLSVSIVLFGFILWLDRNRLDRADSLQEQVDNLKSKIETIMIAKSMGR